MIHQTILLALVGAALSNPQIITPRQNDFGDNEQNGLQNNACAQNIIVFARGTTEGGNVGAIAGPPFFEAMAEEVGEANLAVQGVEYPADVAGFLAGGDADGSQLMAELVEQAVSECPGSNVIMSGYSQGAQLVHNAAEILPSDVTAQVAGVVMFGDPSKFSPPPLVAISSFSVAFSCLGHLWNFLFFLVLTNLSKSNRQRPGCDWHR